NPLPGPGGGKADTAALKAAAARRAGSTPAPGTRFALALPRQSSVPVEDHDKVRRAGVSPIAVHLGLRTTGASRAPWRKPTMQLLDAHQSGREQRGITKVIVATLRISHINGNDFRVTHGDLGSRKRIRDIAKDRD